MRVWGITDRGAVRRARADGVDHASQAVAGRVGRLPGRARHLRLARKLLRAAELTEALGLEPAGLVRLGLLHYNTSDEVERLLAVLRELE